MSRLRFIGRKKPYTVAEIRRTRCICCRERASFQWQCCANGNRWMPLCRKCDIALNELALAFVRLPGRAVLLAAYRRTRAAAGE